MDDDASIGSPLKRPRHTEASDDDQFIRSLLAGIDDDNERVALESEIRTIFRSDDGTPTDSSLTSPSYIESSESEKHSEGATAFEVSVKHIIALIEDLREDLHDALHVDESTSASSSPGTSASSSPLSSSRHAESSETEKQPEILGDLKARVMPIIEGLVEENMRLKNQLLHKYRFLWQPSDSSSPDHPQKYSVPEEQSQHQGMGTDFVEMIFADLKVRTLQVVDGLEREKQALQAQLLRQSRLPNTRLKQHREKVEAITSSEDYITIMASGQLEEDPVQVCANWNNFLSVSPELQFNLLAYVWNKLKDPYSAEEYLICFKRIQRKFNDDDILFVYDKNKRMTFKNFMRGVDNYFKAIPLEDFCKSEDEKLLCNQFREGLTANVFLGLILLDNVQYHSFVLTHYFKQA